MFWIVLAASGGLLAGICLPTMEAPFGPAFSTFQIT
jgi:hypothetical protein